MNPFSDRSGPNILIIANFTADFESGNNRFNYLAELLSSRGASVRLVTSDFSHARKLHRSWSYGSASYAFTRLHEPGYTKNVSLRRLLSCRAFARSVFRFLGGLQSKPDLIICATPPPKVSEVAAMYAKKHGIPFVLDIQDLWPRAFGMTGAPDWLVKFLFSGMRRSTRYAYKSADLVLAVSKTFLEETAALSKAKPEASIVYLGTDLQVFDGFRSHVSRPPDGTVRLVYVGTLSASYDLDLVIRAVARAQRHSTLPLELLVLGDGPLRSNFEAAARSAGIEARFAGKLPYGAMIGELLTCDIAVNPIVERSAGGVLNKVGDYAAAGLPVLNTQALDEYRKLLAVYEAGVSTDPDDVNSLTAELLRLVHDRSECVRLGNNNRKMAEELFDRRRTYTQLAGRLLSLTDSRARF